MSSTRSRMAAPSPAEPISSAGTAANSIRARLRVWSSVGSAVVAVRPAAASTANSDSPPSATATTRQQAGVRPVQHEALVPVQDPAVAALGRGQPDARRVPRAVVLGEGQRRDGLARGDPRQQPLPRALVRAGQQRGRGQHGAGQVRAAVQARAEFLQHDGLLGEREPRAAVLLGDRDALQARAARRPATTPHGRSRRRPSAPGPGPAAPGRSRSAGLSCAVLPALRWYRTSCAQLRQLFSGSVTTSTSRAST